MKGKILGIFGLLVVLCGFMTVMTSDPWYNIGTSKFLQAGNIENLLSRTALYGILGIGVAFVIITSGIDLSIGSMVCLSGVLLAIFLHVEYAPQAGSPVSQVASESNSFETREPVQRLQTGDRIRFSGGRRARTGVYTVKAVEGTTVSVEEDLKNDDSNGEIATTVAVKEVERLGDDAEHGARVVIAGNHDLAVRDRLTLVHPASGLKTEEITAVEKGNDTTTVFLRNDPGDRLTVEWLAIPLIRHQRMSVPMALTCVLAIACTLGLVHGLLVTRARLQPFVVTLCGLLIYRGLSRWLTEDNPAGLGEYSDGLCQLGSGRWNLYTNDATGESFGIPIPFFFLATIGLIAAVFLGKTIWGRYLLALGRNEEAARFSGINTGRVTLMAYVGCTTLAAVGGMLFAMDSLSISPSSFGNFFELYAIAAAVLGGCSLRGGEGSIIGVIIGTAVMQVLNNLIMLLKISGTLEYAIIGSVIMVGVLADELVRFVAARRRRKQSVQE